MVRSEEQAWTPNFFLKSFVVDSVQIFRRNCSNCMIYICIPILVASLLVCSVLCSCPLIFTLKHFQEKRNFAEIYLTKYYFNYLLNAGNVLRTNCLFLSLCIAQLTQRMQAQTLSIQVHYMLDHDTTMLVVVILRTQTQI